MNPLQNLLDWFSDKDNVLVALSGGVDSALVAYGAFHMLGKYSLAVTADYKTLSNEELISAKTICSEIGIPHQTIFYNELLQENFSRNDEKRCYYCRHELGCHLQEIANEKNFDLIVDGTNLDDLGDYRPGLVALEENNIRSPLAELGFTKKTVRKIAKSVNLSVFDKPSNSCLASRIPWGQRITSEKLARIEMGERMIRYISGVSQLRVRDLNGVAKIEVNINELPHITNPINQKKIEEKLKQIGFSSVLIDYNGYSPGKINVILK